MAFQVIIAYESGYLIITYQMATNIDPKNRDNCCLFLVLQVRVFVSGVGKEAVLLYLFHKIQNIKILS
jgi:hypothetical protein